MAFLDTLVMPEPDRTPSIKVYRKCTYIKEYVHWNGHHNIGAKYSVIYTLAQRARTVCSMPELLRTEKEHLRMVLW